MTSLQHLQELSSCKYTYKFSMTTPTSCHVILQSPYPMLFSCSVCLTGTCLPVLQEELAVLTSQQQQLTASESASRQQLAASVQAHEQASAACASAEAELHRLSIALQDSEAQLALAHQNEAQVT